MGKFRNLTGESFGRLTIVKRVENQKNEPMWECLCECGNTIIASSSHLKSGHTKSCGCLQKEKVQQLNKIPFNKHWIEDNILFLEDKKDNICIVDVEDYDKIKHCYWFKSSSVGYWYGTLYEENNLRGKRIGLHQLLMRDYISSENDVVDHYNGDKNDNRKTNLSIVSRKTNRINMKPTTKNNSGVIGVYLTKNNKWVVHISNKYCGSFDSKEEAIKIRLTKEAELFGYYAPQRNLFEKYGITVTNANDEIMNVPKSVVEDF